MYLIHGLEGDRQAIYAKVHHAAIDGVTGVEILATILDVTVEPRVVEPPEEYWEPGPLPGTLDLIGRGLASTVDTAARHHPHPPERASASGRSARRRPDPRGQDR